MISALGVIANLISGSSNSSICGGSGSSPGLDITYRPRKALEDRIPLRRAHTVGMEEPAACIAERVPKEPSSCIAEHETKEPAACIAERMTSATPAATAAPAEAEKGLVRPQRASVSEATQLVLASLSQRDLAKQQLQAEKAAEKQKQKAIEKADEKAKADALAAAALAAANMVPATSSMAASNRPSQPSLAA